MRYSVEPRDRVFVKDYGSLPFPSIVKSLSKNLSGKSIIQELLYHSKQSTTDAFKTASKKAIAKPAKAIGNFSANKTADEITGAAPSIFIRPMQTKHAGEDLLEIAKESYVSSEKRNKSLADID